MSRPYRTRDDEHDVFRALAHPVRRKIITAALHQTQSFDQLCKLTRRNNATLAGHLRILREARLLVVTRIGRCVLYRINQRALRSSFHWLTEVADPAAAPSA